MGIAIITDLNLSISSDNLGQVEFIEDVDLESLTISRGAQSDNKIPFYVSYTPAKTSQRGVIWSVTGNHVSIDASTGILTIEEGAVSESIMVTATSTVNPLISVSYQTTVTFADTPIEFASDAVKNALLSAFDEDEDGEISKTEAASKSIGNELQNFASAVPFTEFRFFTGTTALPKNCFAGAKLTAIEFPSSLKTIGYSSLESMDNITELIFPEGFTTMNNISLRSCSRLAKLDLPTTVTSVFISLSADNAIVIIRNPTVPTKTYVIDLPSTGRIYVPDESVDTYKQHEDYSMHAQKIFGLSTLEE